MAVGTEAALSTSTLTPATPNATFDVHHRVVSCWSLVKSATPFCPVFGRNWTTSGLRSDQRHVRAATQIRTAAPVCLHHLFLQGMSQVHATEIIGRMLDVV